MSERTFLDNCLESTEVDLPSELRKLAAGPWSAVWSYAVACQAATKIENLQAEVAALHRQQGCTGCTSCDPA